MRTFVDDNLIDNRLKQYPVFMKQVAREENVRLIDANVFMRDTVLLLGAERSKDLYLWIGAGVDSTYKEGREDDTHMCEAGARAVAEFIAKELTK
jgi:lysophospholipase L1-like esterase